MPDAHNKVEVEEREINLLELLEMLLKRRMLIVKVCCVAAVASVIYSLSLPNIYSATAKVLPPQKESGGGLSALLGQAGGLASLAVGGGFAGGSDLYVGILKSRSVGDAVIKRLDLMRVNKSTTLESARESLSGAVKIQAGKDGIILISAENKDPKLSAQIANTLVDELAKTTVRLNLTKASTERVFLEKRLDLVKKDLKSAEDDLKTFAQRNNIVQVESQTKASIEGIARLKAELASKEVQLSILRSRQTEQGPEVQASETGIRRLKDEIGRLAGASGDSGVIPSVGRVPGIGLEYSRKMRELKTQEAVFEQLTKQYELAKINEAKDSSSLQVLDEAVVPLKRSRPGRTLIVIMSTVGAFFTAIFMIFLQHYLAGLSEGDRKILDNIKKYALTLK